MCKKRDKKIKIDWSVILPPIIFLGFCALAIMLGVSLYNSFNWMSEGERGAFVTIYASVASGFCALIGVLVQILFSKQQRDKNFKDQNSPAFFIPCKYDIAKAEKIPLYLNETRVPSVTKQNFYFTNSEKAPFFLESVKYANIMFSAKDFFVEKGKLFCLNFEKKYGVFNEYEMTIRSLSGTHYSATVRFKDRFVKIQEVPENAVN